MYLTCVFVFRLISLNQVKADEILKLYMSCLLIREESSHISNQWNKENMNIEELMEEDSMEDENVDLNAGSLDSNNSSICFI